ncbi:MAG TPA: monofunctional biosynthetic peptidoglycan transglycosylase, partial [Stellaceae bacterium]|nr:monofunctional biosynthetic peptidoglycan transglycosylase [Stellaceae bacterium]
MLRRIGRILAFSVAAFLIGSVLLVALFREVAPPATPLMLLRRIEGYGIVRKWRPLDEISPHLVRAVMASEDARFCRHRGFDWDAIGEAWRRYRRGTGRLRGASTISMQTAKNVFLRPGRDWVRKVLEAYFTALIELAWGKQRIIEIYLNVVEWGPGIYGAEAAARFHFHKSVAALSGASRRGAARPARLVGSAAQPLCARARRVDPGADAGRAHRHRGVPVSRWKVARQTRYRLDPPLSAAMCSVAPVRAGADRRSSRRNGHAHLSFAAIPARHRAQFERLTSDASNPSDRPCASA